MMTPAEWFESTEKKINENPQAIEGLKGSFEFNYEADGNGIWHISFPGDGTYEMGEGELPGAQVKVKTKWSCMWDMMNGKLNPNVALLTGKVKFKGDMKVMMSLQKIADL